MGRLLIVGFLVGLGCWGQDAVPNTQQTPAAQDQAQPAAPKDQTVTIPAGTRIPLSLASPITNKAARPGAPVRATTGFPVTVGTQLAIPVGAYVDGVIDHITKGSSSGPSLQMHFTRLIYPNGYTVTLDGANVQARLLEPNAAPSSETAALQENGGATMAFAGQQSPPAPPPLPHSGPNTGLIVGGLVGTAAIGILAVVLLGHHHAGNALLFDTGWQFDMVLQSPVMIDMGSAGINGAGTQ